MSILILLLFVAANAESFREKLVNATVKFDENIKAYKPYPLNVTTVVTALENRCSALAHLGMSCMSCQIDFCIPDALLGTENLIKHNEWIRDALNSAETKQAATDMLRALLHTVNESWNAAHPDMMVSKGINQWVICWK
jgi:hypothetical protein